MTEPILSSFSSDDERFMRRAIELAAEAAEAGEVPVGAVLVSEGAIVGEGRNAPIGDHDPSAHAEMAALRAAGKALKNYRLPKSTLYVTLEPCVMCAGAMLHARVDRLVFGAFDPKTGMAGSVFNVFSDISHYHQLNAEGGLLADECAEQLQAFFRARRKASKDAKKAKA